MDTHKIAMRKPRMVAHRGLSGLERENTCAAFVAAGNRSYFGIETDVHCTADGQYVIIHDDTTTRVTGQELVVEETDMATLRQLRLFDVGMPAPIETWTTSRTPPKSWTPLHSRWWICVPIPRPLAGCS